MKRLLSAAAMFAWAGGHVPINHALTAQLTGRFSPERLSTALRAVRQKYPHLAGRLIHNEDGLWYESEGVPDFPVRTVTGDWTEAVAQELTACFPTEEGPLVRFLVVDAGPHTYLSIVCHHCIADGLSAFYVLRDILQVMADPDLSFEPLSPLPPLETLIPPLDLSGFSPEQIPMPDLNDKPSSLPAEGYIYVLPWSLSAEQTTALITRCRAEQTTVHAALSTALSIAYATLQIGGSATERTISTPVNFRDRLTQPVGENFGLFNHPGTDTTLDYQPGRDFWEMARTFNQSLKGDLTNENIFAQHMMAAQVIKMMPYEQLLPLFAAMPVAYDLSITNLGRLDLLVDYGDFQLEGVYGPAVCALENEQVMGVATAAGRLTCTFVARRDRLDRATAEQLRDTVLAQLTDVVGW